MKVVLLGSRGNISKPLTKLLVSEGLDVTVITRSTQNAEAIREDGAKAAIGSADDLKFLKETFKGATTVFILIAADLFEKDALKKMNAQCDIICDAILEEEVSNVVFLSSIGSDNPKLGFHFENESILKRKLVDLPSVSIVRPSGFFTNFYRSFDTIKKDQVIYSNVPRGQIESYVHPNDVALVCSELILNPPVTEKFRIVNVESDVATPEEVERLLSDALKFEIKWVSVPDNVAKESAIKAGLPEENAELLVNLFSQVYHGEMENAIRSQGSVKGKSKLADFFKNEFAPGFNN